MVDSDAAKRRRITDRERFCFYLLRDARRRALDQNSALTKQLIARDIFCSIWRQKALEKKSITRSSLISLSFTLSLSRRRTKSNDKDDAQKQQKQRSEQNLPVRGVSLEKRNRHSREYRRGKNVEQFGPKRFEENIPRGRVHDRDAVLVRVQILERNRETNRERVEPGENED